VQSLELCHIREAERYEDEETICHASRYSRAHVRKRRRRVQNRSEKGARHAEQQQRYARRRTIRKPTAFSPREPGDAYAATYVFSVLRENGEPANIARLLARLLNDSQTSAIAHSPLPALLLLFMLALRSQVPPNRATVQRHSRQSTSVIGRQAVNSFKGRELWFSLFSLPSAAAEATPGAVSGAMPQQRVTRRERCTRLRSCHAS